MTANMGQQEYVFVTVHVIILSCWYFIYYFKFLHKRM